MANLGLLPLELVKRIIDNVSKTTDLYECALINTSFYAIANRKLWRAPIKRKLTHRHCKVIYSTASSVLFSIHLSYSHSLHDGAPLCSFIRQLWFGKGDLVVDILKLLRLCPSLEEFGIQGHKVTDTGMERIFRSSPGLKSIRLWGLKKITDKSIASMVRLCPLAYDIDLQLNSTITEQTMVTLKDYTLTRLAIHSGGSIHERRARAHIVDFQQLTHLALSFSFRDQILDTLSATSKNGSTPLPLLVSVDFSFVKEPQPTEALVHFIKTHPLLRSLGLKKGTIDDALQPALIHLHELKLRNMTLSHPFTVTYPKLQQLYLVVDSIKKSTYFSIATAMPNLQLLDIKTTGHVSNSCSKEIIHRCTQLTFFDVTYHHPASTHRLIAGMNARKTFYKRHMDRIRNNTEKMDTND